MKKSRKSTHPSKSNENHFEIAKSSNNILISTHENQSFNRLEDNNFNKIHHNIHNSISSKRPRLTCNKRLEANARERERVHNLTAAFEALRQVIPICDKQSKLSRLSILRIACSYMHVLGALNEIDFSDGRNSCTLNESFHTLSCTILNELKRKKSTNKIK